MVCAFLGRASVFLIVRTRVTVLSSVGSIIVAIPCFDSSRALANWSDISVFGIRIDGVQVSSMFVHVLYPAWLIEKSAACIQSINVGVKGLSFMFAVPACCLSCLDCSFGKNKGAKTTNVRSLATLFKSGCFQALIQWEINEMLPAPPALTMAKSPSLVIGSVVPCG